MKELPIFRGFELALQKFRREAGHTDSQRLGSLRIGRALARHRKFSFEVSK